MTGAFFGGYFSALGLIMIVGAQNAFVLRQGLRREHVAAVVAFCAGSDAILIAAGVAGLDAAVTELPWLAPFLRYFGAAFLAGYGTLRFIAASRGGAALVPREAGGAPLHRVLLSCAIITWANPHVYLDTVVLLGSIAVGYAPHQWLFALGAALASCSFFTVLGFGAARLAPIFARPRAWMWLDVGMGVLMWGLAVGLLWL